MWNWHAGKAALEYLFFTGVVTAPRPHAGFERVYDLTERVLPAGGPRDPDARTAPTPSGSWCAPPPAPSASPPRRTCATTSGCRPGDARTAIAELADAGELLPVDGRRLGPAGLAGPGGPPARAGSGRGRC